MLSFRGGINLKDFWNTRKTSNPLDWLLLDRFFTNRTSVDGTLAEPGPGVRSVVEANGATVSVVGSELEMVGDGVSAGNCTLNYTSPSPIALTTRGLFMFADLKPSTDTCGYGFEPAGPDLCSFFRIADAVRYRTASIDIAGAFTHAANEWNTIRVIARNPGLYVLVDDILQYVDDTYANTNSLLSAANNTFGFPDSDALYVDNLRITTLDSSDSTLYPAPVMSDNFSDSVSVVDYGSNGFDGTPTKVGLTGSYGVYGGASYTNIYSAAFNTKFNGEVGTAIIELTPENTAVWTDGVQREALNLQVNTSNRVLLYKPTSANFFSCRYSAGGTNKEVSKAMVAGTTFTAGITWSDASINDRVRVFFDGVQEGVDQVGNGNFVGSLGVNNTVIGALFVSDPTGWRGIIKNVVIGFGVEASPAEIATIDGHIVAGTLTTAILDGIFGAGNYAWYKHDEQYTTDGNGHVEGSQGDGLSWSGPYYNTGNKAYGVVLVGDNVIVNGVFAADTDWTKGTGWSIAAGVATHAAGTASTLDQTVAPLTANIFYRSYHTVTGRTAGSSLLVYGTANGGTRSTNDTFTETRRCVSTGAFSVSATAPFDGNEDNVIVNPLLFTDLLRNVESTTEPYLESSLTITADTQAGVVINLDDATNPQNCIHVWYDRVDSTVYARELLAGVWQADRLAISLLYSAGANLAIRRIGDGVLVSYNDGTVGNFTTVVPDTGTLAALFATDGNSYFEDTAGWPTGGYDYSRYD